MRKVFVLIVTAAILTVSMGSSHADSLIIKFKKGHTQVIKLKKPLEDIQKLEFVKDKAQNKTQKDIQIKKTFHIKSNQPKEKGKSKDNKKIINFGNGIKGEWETPNPYLPPANE